MNKSNTSERLSKISDLWISNITILGDLDRIVRFGFE